MIVLHAGFLEDWLLLWGERPAAADGGGRRGPRNTAPRHYVHDAGAAALMEALQGAQVAFKPAARHIQGLTAWLPTRGGHPVPSSGLIGEEPSESATGTTLAPWSITAYPLLPGEAVDLLCLCVGKRTLASGVVVGQDLGYWTAVLRFAGSLVARQQYLPGLIRDEDGYRARWEPIWDGGDGEALAALARAMPPMARALAGPDLTAPPSISAVSCLRQFVASAVDHLVRSTALGPRKRAFEAGKRQPAFASAHDAWLYALSSPDGTVHGELEALARLAAQIDEWRRPLAVSATSPVRLCFRLDEPEQPVARGPQGEGVWFVHYLLQARDDPSLLIPVQQVWKGGRRTIAALGGDTVRLGEYLLAALGQAAGICPHIEASLKRARPAGHELNTREAHEFLTEKAMLLEQAGFGVMLPSWWTGKGAKDRLEVRARIKSPDMRTRGGLTLETLVQFNWEVALGDVDLTREDLETLARLKEPLVRIRGRWVEVNAEEIQAAIALLEKRASGTAREIVRMALGGMRSEAGLTLSSVKADGWMGRLIERLEGARAFEEMAVPEGFAGTLRPYQIRGYSWLSFLRHLGLGACLADDMGLGKTVQTLALIQQDWERNGKRPVLLVCPTSVMHNWRKEATRFTPGLPVLVHHGTGRSKGTEFRKTAQGHAVVVSSYVLLQRDLSHLQEVAWAGVVVDEAQNIKNPETKQARAARSLKADYRVALTGTPVENNVGDLWSIMDFLNPGFLGSRAEFKRTFLVPIQATRDPEAAARLKRLTGPFLLRRLKTDKAIIADLPEKMEMKTFCPLTREQASLYAAVVRDLERMLESVAGIQRKGAILGTLTKLKQVCNHPAQFLGDNSAIPGRSGKLARLTEMLEEIMEVGDRALVFTQFAEMGKILQGYLQESFGREILFLHGGVPPHQRERLVERFQGEGGPPVFVLSLKAGGTGLNLTRANRVFHFDRWWNPAVENQATDRAFRIGQRRNVQVHKLVCAGTLEERIDEMIARKQELAEKVVGAGEGWLTELSNKEISEIFTLREEAIGGA
jgi:SNF2 family DNA or RNA helicase